MWLSSPLAVPQWVDGGGRYVAGWSASYLTAAGPGCRSSNGRSPYPRRSSPASSDPLKSRDPISLDSEILNPKRLDGELLNPEGPDAEIINPQDLDGEIINPENLDSEIINPRPSRCVLFPDPSPYSLLPPHFLSPPALGWPGPPVPQRPHRRGSVQGEASRHLPAAQPRDVPGR